MTVINSNTSALLAQNANRMANSSLQNAMEQLSTGKRINTAADDAAGYAISAKMTSTERGMAVAIRNANDGVSMMQTANSALDSVTNMLQRMQELATQSANGTLGDSERASLQAENDQLVSQINDIAKTTNFNGINLLDGSLKNLTLQVGTGSTDKVALNIGSASAGSLGLTAIQGVSTGRVAGMVSGTDTLTLNGVSAFATTTPAFSIATTDTNQAKTLAAGINANSARTGVEATAYNTVTTQAVTGPVKAGDLEIGGKAVGAAADAQGLVDNINKGSYGVTATLNSDNTITLSNSDGSDINLSGSQSTGTGGVLATGADVNNSGFVALNSTDGSNFTVAASGTDAAAYVNSYSATGVTGTAVGTTDNTPLAAGALTINGVSIGAATGGTGAPGNASSYATAINAVASQTGVYATADSTGKITLSSTNGGNITIGGTNPAVVGLKAQGDAHAQSDTLDISTQASASAALDTITKALDTVTSVAGKLGALENRMNVTIDNLTSASSNLEDARSRIQDADFSAETTSLAKAQILSQASTAMLAQANQSQQGVLKLLQ